VEALLRAGAAKTEQQIIIDLLHEAIG